MKPLTPVAEAASQLSAHARCLTDSERIPLLEATGRVLATDIVAPCSVPPADNSAMDGYAIRYQDLPLNPLPVSMRVQAGDAPATLPDGSAARIFTGAEIPDGADTVVIQENCQLVEPEQKLQINELPKPGANIRPKGQDIEQGQTVVNTGTRLRAQEIGLIASLGIAEIDVYRPLTVAVVNTGNELVEPGQTLTAGKIYNSNRFLLHGMLQRWGMLPKHINVVSDSLQETQDALSELAQTTDLIISTGGVSVGEEDYIKPAVESLGELNLWKIAIKPGKPFAFGHIQQDHKATPFIGLPGNPASAFVTMLILARPYLLAAQGRRSEDITIRSLSAPAAFSRKVAGREEYLRCRYTASGVDLYPNQSSGVLLSASWGDCLVRQPIGQAIEPGQMVDVLPYSELCF